VRSLAAAGAAIITSLFLAACSEPGSPASPVAPNQADGAPTRTEVLPPDITPTTGAPTAASIRDAAGAVSVDRNRRVLPIVESGSGPAAPASGCSPRIATRQGIHLVLDGEPFAFFGVNAPYLVDGSYPQDRVEAVISDLVDRGVNTIRIWFFAGDDPDRMLAFHRCILPSQRPGVVPGPDFSDGRRSKWQMSGAGNRPRCLSRRVRQPIHRRKTLLPCLVEGYATMRNISSRNLN